MAAAFASIRAARALSVLGRRWPSRRRARTPGIRSRKNLSVILREAVRTLVQMHHVQAHLDVKEIGGGNPRLFWVVPGGLSRGAGPPPDNCALALGPGALAPPRDAPA